MSDRIAVMSPGRILQIGTPARHLRSPGRALRRRFHRRDQFPRRRDRRVAEWPARTVKLRIGRRLLDGDLARRAQPRRQGDGGGAARACATVVAPRRRCCTGTAREHRLFRHRHALSMCGSTSGGAFIVRQQNARGGDSGFRGRRPRRHRDRRRRRADPEGLSMASRAEQSPRRRERERQSVDRWLLSAPALVIIFFAAVGPLLIVLVYSFLTPGAYGGVEVDSSRPTAGSASSSSATFSTTRCPSRRCPSVDPLALGQAVAR